MRRLLILALALALPALAGAQKIRAVPYQIAVGGGAIIGDNGIIASWDSAFATVQWHGIQLFEDNVSTGLGIELHPASVISVTEDKVRISSIDAVDARVWSMNRVKMSVTQLPGSIWDLMYAGTDLLIYEIGSKDYTGDFDARLVYGVKDKVGPGEVVLEIYMFEKYRPVSFAALYRWVF
jgi:hypothetical protein